MKFNTQLIFLYGTRLLLSTKYSLNTKSWLPRLSQSTILSFCGIFLSVATLLIVSSVFNGFKTEFTKTIIGINAPLSIIPNYQYGLQINNTKKLVNQLYNLSDIKKAIPIITGEGMLINPQINSGAGVLVRGIDPSDFLAKPIFANSLQDGNINSLKTNQILIGTELANSKNLQINDTVRLVSSQGSQTLFGFIPRHKDFVIGGIFKTGTSLYDSNLAVLSFDNAAKFFGYHEDQASAIELILHPKLNITDRQSIADISNSIREKIPYNIDVTTWYEQNMGFVDAINTQSGVMFFILSLFVIVASFILFSNINNLVTSKTKQIAILQILGATKYDIMAIFVLTGTIISVTAILLGCTFGTLFALNIENIKNCLETTFNMQIFNGAFYFLSYLPSKIYIKDIVFTCLFSFVLSFLSTFIPVLKILKQNPSHATKYE